MRQQYINEYLEQLYFDELIERDMVRLNEVMLNESFEVIGDAAVRSVDAAKQLVSDFGVSAAEIKYTAKKSYLKVKRMIEKREDPELVAKTITGSVEAMIKPKMQSIMDKVDERLKNKDIDKHPIIAGIVLLILVLVVQGIISGIFMSLFGFGVGMYLTCVIVAPFSEELLKRIAIVNNRPYIITGIFAVSEAIMFLLKAIMSGTFIGVYIIQRAGAILLHFSLMWIQKYFMRKAAEKKAIGEDTYKSLLSYLIPVFIHSLNNAVGALPLLTGGEIR